jgi:hypothetical protein
MVGKDEAGKHRHDQKKKREANKTPEKQFTGRESQLQSSEIKKQSLQKPHDLSSGERYNRKPEKGIEVPKPRFTEKHIFKKKTMNGQRREMDL